MKGSIMDNLEEKTIEGVEVTEERLGEKPFYKSGMMYLFAIFGGSLGEKIGLNIGLNMGAASSIAMVGGLGYSIGMLIVGYFGYFISRQVTRFINNNYIRFVIKLCIALLFLLVFSGLISFYHNLYINSLKQFSKNVLQHVNLNSLEK